MTKNPKFSNFQSFYAIFVKFSTDFVDWNVEKSQQGTNLLSSSLFRRDLGRKISRWSAGVLFKCHSNIESNLFKKASIKMQATDAFMDCAGLVRFIFIDSFTIFQVDSGCRRDVKKSFNFNKPGTLVRNSH